MKKLNSGYCEKCNEQLVNGECPYCTKPTPSVLVWHDEKDSRLYWTYCGRFKILGAYLSSFALYRIHPETSYHGYIGEFPDLQTAKLIASIIRANEI